VLVIESLVCGNFSPQQLDEAVSSPIPFFLKQEKRMEDGNQVWRFERQDLSGYYTMRIVMDPGGGDEVCQASMRKV
jgi:hypothetical protein